MHNLGPSQLEQSSYEFAPFPNQELYPGQHEYAQHEYAGEFAPAGMSGSPLEIAFAQEAPLMEFPGHEVAYRESPIGHEFASHETMGHEAPVYETAYEGEFAYEDEFASGEFNEEDEMALTAEFMEIQTEEELDRFIGKLVRRAARGVRNFARSSLGRALGGVLRTVGRYALPAAGAALGTFVGGPIGAKLGSQLGSMASNKLGLELTGLTHEEANFATGRQFVRFAMNAARNAAMAAPNRHPNLIARTAVQQAAQRFAPGLLGPNHGRIRIPRAQAQNRGVWVRRGSAIILYGA
jgi:hypothetical protein